MVASILIRLAESAAALLTVTGGKILVRGRGEIGGIVILIRVILLRAGVRGKTLIVELAARRTVPERRM